MQDKMIYFHGKFDLGNTSTTIGTHSGDDV